MANGKKDLYSDISAFHAGRFLRDVVQRREMLDGMITFMRLHAPVMKGFKSHEVLKAVLG